MSMNIQSITGWQLRNPYKIKSQVCLRNECKTSFVGVALPAEKGDLRVNDTDETLSAHSDEVSQKSIDAVAKLSQKNIPLIFGIGMFDYINRHNGLSVVMGNSKEDVRKHAKVVTADIFNDGFAKVIKYIVEDNI